MRYYFQKVEHVVAQLEDKLSFGIAASSCNSFGNDMLLGNMYVYVGG